jgi:hypothetical protein
MTLDHLPPQSLFCLNHDEAHWVLHAELAQQLKPTRPRKRKPTLASVAQAALPPTLAPRLICRDAAAAYVGVSPNTFDKMIADGLMPPNPHRAARIKIRTAAPPAAVAPLSASRRGGAVP